MWFIIVTFLNSTIPNSNMNEIFIFSNPSFAKQSECNEYVQVMNMDIYGKAAASYNFKYTPEAIYCLEKNQVETIMKEYKIFLEEKPKINS